MSKEPTPLKADSLDKRFLWPYKFNEKDNTTAHFAKITAVSYGINGPDLAASFETALTRALVDSKCRTGVPAHEKEWVEKALFYMSRLNYLRTDDTMRMICLWRFFTDNASIAKFFNWKNLERLRQTLPTTEQLEGNVYYLEIEQVMRGSQLTYEDTTEGKLTALTASAADALNTVSAWVKHCVWGSPPSAQPISAQANTQSTTAGLNNR
ncbi:MAG: hypothetical protein A3E84_02110 [Gammaproteobacteria bacterium RIFCSPHIGHO2_12_FULL_42_13]|nr:MAG: hypothetical protein A3E84_02110 [Gammaproteobacteria bacterium RIFCSPHIGHO2_12_FULL_42_13]